MSNDSISDITNSLAGFGTKAIDYVEKTKEITDSDAVTAIGKIVDTKLTNIPVIDRTDNKNSLIDPVTGKIADGGLFISLAQLIDPIINGPITRDANGAAISAALVWPDGATGVYTATQVSAAFPGAVDAYTCTRVVGGVMTTYTQPAVTRDASGAVVNKPAIVVS